MKSTSCGSRGHGIRRGGLRGLLIAVALLASTAGLLNLAGCTVFPEQKSPSLAKTTSAEQNERIFWEMVRKQQWNSLDGLLAANIVWTLPGKTLDREQIVPYLQGLKITEYNITGVTVKANGPDMTVAYTVQLPSGAGTVKAVQVVSVWQQLKAGWIMTVRSEQPSA